MRFSSLAATAATVSFANALSSSCTTELAVLALGDVGSCLQLTSLLPVLSASGSIVSSINTYLGSLCSSSTPTCSNSSLTSAVSALNSSCSSDISGGGSDAAEVVGLESVLKSYPQFYAAGCSKNSSTGGYCVTETLTTVQTDVGTNLTVSFLTSLLSGTGDTSSLTTALDSGNLCTGCVGTIYQQALSANASIANTTIGQGLTSKCGANFGATTSTASGVSTVSTAASSATSSASSSATSSKSAADGVSKPLSALLPIAVAGASILGAVAFGGYSVL